MEFKDIIALSISTLAFFLSITATIISLIRSKYERQRAIRNELTEVLNQIISVGLENAKVLRDAPDDPTYAQNISATLNQRNTFLLQQAMFLVEQIPDLATGVEYNTIAAANANSGDVISAEKYHEKAILAARNNYYKSLATRSYAAFLFVQHRFEEGRDSYKKSITLLSGSGDLVRYTNGLTYQMWAWNELHNAQSPKRSEEFFESALNEFNGIDNKMARENAILGLRTIQLQQQKPVS